jgi:hypothetical protein
MTSPFPGMDPYLESHWGDVHARFVTYTGDQLQPQLPRDLRARLEERIVVTPPDDGDPRHLVPDIRVVKRARLEPGIGGGAAVAELVEVAEPLVIELGEQYTETFLKIVEAKSLDRVITVIEILSFANKKPGEDRAKFAQKRQELAAAGISLVEIDLLRSGSRELGHPLLVIPESHQTTYQACVHKGWRRTEYEVYRLPLRERLPKISIPLRPTDHEVVLDLQAILNQCYVNGAYDDTNYTVDPIPPLQSDDAQWADMLLHEKGLR